MTVAELVIFDCDGVLVDSEPIANRILLEVVAEVGLPMTADESMATFVGRSATSCMAIIEERLGRPLPPTFLPDWNTRLFAAFRGAVQPVTGVAAAIEALTVPYCVASSGSRERMAVTLGTTGLLSRFEGRLFSATDVPRGKPFPDLYLHAASCMGVRPERCVVVEDAVVGVEAGVAAGMTVYGFAGNAHSDAGQLRRAGAAAVFTRMHELPALLQGRSAEEEPCRSR